MSECSKCGYWRRLDDYPTMGDCLVNGGNTTAGYWCEEHQPREGKPKAEPRTREPLNIEAAADKVMAAGLAAINIETVQRVIRCGYGDAARVIELLREQGKIS